MITLELIQRIWSLIPSPAADGSVDAHELAEIVTPQGHPRLTVDVLQQHHLLIPLSSAELIIDKHSAGVHLLATVWGESGQEQRFVDLVCLKPYLNGVFDLIVYEILTELVDSPEAPGRVCLRVLNRWREMVAREPVNTPDKSAIVGLFGEMLILRQMLQHRLGALGIWTGPDKGRYDFYSAGMALEVKTSLQRHGTVLTIHGHDQLEVPANGTLHLIVMKVEEVPGSGESLHELVESIVGLGTARFDLYSRLAQIGIYPETIEETSAFRLRLVNQRFFRVDSGFPRIVSNSFLDGTLPRGVLTVTYQIDLSNPPPFPLSDEEAAAILRSTAESAA